MINDAADGAFAAFAKGFDGGMPQLVSRELVADTQTPVSAYLRLASGSRNTFLLESVEGGEIRGRFSVIGLSPDLIWRCRGNVAEINRDPANSGEFSATATPRSNLFAHSWQNPLWPILVTCRQCLPVCSAILAMI